MEYFDNDWEGEIPEEMLEELWELLEEVEKEHNKYVFREKRKERARRFGVRI